METSIKGPSLARALRFPWGMSATSYHITLGKSGETYACLELERRGYAILDRRYRTRAGEIDVVARDGDTLVFIEVKARRSTRFGTAAEAITGQKRRKLMQMASLYILSRRLAHARCRFDVVTVTFGTGERLPKIDVIKAAFDAGSGT